MEAQTGMPWDEKKTMKVADLPFQRLLCPEDHRKVEEDRWIHSQEQKTRDEKQGQVT